MNVLLPCYSIFQNKFDDLKTDGKKTKRKTSGRQHKPVFKWTFLFYFNDSNMPVRLIITKILH